MHMQTIEMTKPIVTAATTMSRGMSQQAVNRIASVGSTARKAQGEVLFSEGDVADNIFEVVQGTLRLYKLLPDGRRQITGFLTAGQLLGLAPEGAYVYTAEAITQVTVCRYRRQSLDRLMDEVPALARRLLAVTSNELRAAQDQMLLLGRKTAAEKLASFLLRLADQQSVADNDDIDVPMTRTDIADYLGLTMETVSRSLTKMKRDGLIALPCADRIEILDHDQLEELAAGEIDSDL